MKQISEAQIVLYKKWFNALMALENSPIDDTAEDKNKLLGTLLRAKEAAIAANVPNIR